MRPIDQHGLDAAFSAEAALAKEVLFFPEPSADEAPGPPQPVRSSVGAEVDKLEALLARGYDPAGDWSQAGDSDEAARLAGRIGDGYEAAIGALIERSGAYCAYCEIAQPTGLRVDPVKPASWFPREAFDPANLLLACPPCRARKLAGLGRRSGQLSGHAGPVRPLWPQRYWQGLPSPSPLPFRHRLYETRGGGAAGRRPVSLERAWSWVAAYRQGLIGVESREKGAPRLVFPAPAAVTGEQTRASSDPLYLTAWVETGPEASPDGAARETIELLDLNCLAGDPNDRRQELRTRAFLTALDCWERIDSIGRLPGPDASLREAAERIRDSAVKTTGFWGLWLQVFRDTPDIQVRLAGLLPGTAAAPFWET